MKALAFFVHIEDLLKDLTAAEWEAVADAIGRVEKLISDGKAAAAAAAAHSGSAPASGSVPRHFKGTAEK